MIISIIVVALEMMKMRRNEKEGKEWGRKEEHCNTNHFRVSTLITSPFFLHWPTFDASVVEPAAN